MNWPTGMPSSTAALYDVFILCYHDAQSLSFGSVGIVHRSWIQNADTCPTSLQ